MNYVSGSYFYKEVFKNIFLIGCHFEKETPIQKSWFDMQDKYELGTPTGNSWLIKGKNKAILIDSAAPVKGLREFAENLADVPVIFVLSHGHFDHTYCLEEFDEFWIHQEDMYWLTGAFGFPEYSNIPDKKHFLSEGDSINLGDREIKVFNIRGHTNGSLLLLDSKSKVLFTGDSIARRILLYDINCQKIKDYFNKIYEMKSKNFNYICSCHDRVPLHKEYIDFIFENIVKIKDIQTPRELFNKSLGEFYCLKLGDEKTEQFLNCSILTDYRDTLVETVLEINKKGDDKYDS